MNKEESDQLEKIFKKMAEGLESGGNVEVRLVAEPMLFYGPWVVAHYHSAGATSILGSGNTPQEAYVNALHTKKGTEIPPF